VPPAVPISGEPLVPFPDQDTATPPAVMPAGPDKVTVRALSGSTTLIVPVRVARLVVSLGLPVVSAKPFKSPSSETETDATPTTGESLVPLMVIVSVAVLVSPSLSVMV
jgi:hypothetical protein